MGNFFKMKNLKRQTGICMLMSALIVLMSPISCKQPIDETDNNLDQDISVVDISQETDWNYIVFGEDGSSMFINVNESNDIPTLLFLRPDKDSDDGITVFFKENGLPDKMVSDGHILYFGNFNGYRFDLAIIYPNNTIEYHFDIETDVNWDSYNGRFISSQARFIGGLFRWAMPAILCTTSFFFPSFFGVCATSVIVNVSKVVVEEVFDGFTEDLGKTLIDVMACASGSYLSCLWGLAGSANLLTHLDFNLTTEKTTQINEVIRRIDGDGLTIIPPDLLEDLLRLGIEINHGRNPPNIRGTYLVSPVVLVRSNFADTSSSGRKFADIELTFSNQDNAKMTVECDYVQSGTSITQTGSGTAFLTGDGNKFSVFVENDGTYNGRQFVTVDIYSGEITSAGIKDYYNAFIAIVEAPGTVSRGQGRLFYDSDGLSVRIYGGRALLGIQGQGIGTNSSEVLLPEIYSSGN